MKISGINAECSNGIIGTEEVERVIGADLNTTTADIKVTF